MRGRIDPSVLHDECNAALKGLEYEKCPQVFLSFPRILQDTLRRERAVPRDRFPEPKSNMVTW